MVTVIPAMGMMVIAIIVMGLVATRQGESHGEEEDPRADEAFQFICHNN